MSEGPASVPDSFLSNFIHLQSVEIKLNHLLYCILGELCAWMYYKKWIWDWQYGGVAIFPVATRGTAVKNPIRTKKHFLTTIQKETVTEA